jgi:hypothetical protein
MANPDPTVKFDYATLTSLSGRLSRRADDIVMIACQDMAADFRLAARMASKFASLRFRVGEIADIALNQDGAATARDLRRRPLGRGGQLTCSYILASLLTATRKH